MGAFLFRAKNRPGLNYTQRQIDILYENIPSEEVRTTELAAIMKKAAERGDDYNYSLAESMYYYKTHPDAHIPKYTEEEARAVLQSLTPWTIHWKTELKQNKSGQR